MSRTIPHYLAASILFLLLCSVTPGEATNFAMVGPEAIGMGGASVAAPQGAWSIYWNPGAYDSSLQWDVVFPGAGFHVEQHNQVFKKLDDILDIMGDYNLDDEELTNDSELVKQITKIVHELDRTGTGFIVDGHAGCLVKIDKFMFGYLGLAYGGVSAVVDTEHLDVGDINDPNSIANNTSAIDSWGIIGHQFVIGYTLPVVTIEEDDIRYGHQLSIGAMAKFIAASTYSFYASVYDKDVDDSTKKSPFSENERLSGATSYDIGLSYVFNGHYHVGIVFRDINTPRFTRATSTIHPEEKLTLPMQVRAGLMYTHQSDFSVGLDMDVTDNESSTLDGYGDRRFSFGLSKGLWNRHLTVRAGYYQNIAEQGSDSVVTFGLGTRVGSVFIDAAFGITPSNYGSDNVLYIDETTAALALTFRGL